MVILERILQRVAYTLMRAVADFLSAELERPVWGTQKPLPDPEESLLPDNIFDENTDLDSEGN